MYIVGRIKYWRRLVIDSVNKSILAEGNFSPGIHFTKSTSTTFDGIKYIRITWEGNSSTIYVIPRESSNVLAAQSISLDQADFLREQFERRTGLQVGQSYAMIKTIALH